MKEFILGLTHSPSYLWNYVRHRSSKEWRTFLMQPSFGLLFIWPTVPRPFYKSSILQAHFFSLEAWLCSISCDHLHSQCFFEILAVVKIQQQSGNNNISLETGIFMSDIVFKISKNCHFFLIEQKRHSFQLSCVSRYLMCIEYKCIIIITFYRYFYFHCNPSSNLTENNKFDSNHFCFLCF